MPKLEGYDVRDMGVAWYTPETWRQLEAHPESKMQKTYPEYLRDYERCRAGFAAQGFRAVKVPIDFPLMVEWCHKHGYTIDTKGRAAFTGAVMLARDTGKDVMTMPFSDRTRTEH